MQYTYACFVIVARLASLALVKYSEDLAGFSVQVFRPSSTFPRSLSLKHSLFSFVEPRVPLLFFSSLESFYVFSLSVSFSFPFSLPFW